MRVQEGVYWYREKGPFDANTYVIEDELTLMIDPGLRDYLKLRLEEMERDNMSMERVDIVMITHLHPDHYDAVAVLKENYDLRVALHTSQLAYLEPMIEEAARFFGMPARSRLAFCADMEIKDVLRLGDRHELQVIHTPGHSPDSICLYSPGGKFLVSGDLVFEHGVGRTDLPFGNEEELIRSIHRISLLETELLLTGHGSIIKGRAGIASNYEFIRSFYGYGDNLRQT